MPKSFSAPPISRMVRESVWEETAKEIASGVTGINSALWRENKTDKGVFSFSHGDVAVEISKSGMLCRLINPMPCKTAKISAREAEEKANEFLMKNGYKNMIALRRENGEFTASFLFYPLINSVLLMTSPVEIGICTSNGETVYFNSLEYISNYTEDIHIPVTSPDISGVLPENVTATRSFYCLKEINGRERLCILSECEYDNYKYYIYTDAETMKILKTENA